MESSLKRQIINKKRELKALEKKYQSIVKQREEQRKQVIKTKYKRNQERSNKVVNKTRKFYIDLSKKNRLR